ncbi:MAG: hypothetical protein V4812_04690 [Pseudomonadota bacterium]
MVIRKKQADGVGEATHYRTRIFRVKARIQAAVMHLPVPHDEVEISGDGKAVLLQHENAQDNRCHGGWNQAKDVPGGQATGYANHSDGAADGKTRNIRNETHGPHWLKSKGCACIRESEVAYARDDIEE